MENMVGYGLQFMKREKIPFTYKGKNRWIDFFRYLALYYIP